MKPLMTLLALLSGMGVSSSEPTPVRDGEISGVVIRIGVYSEAARDYFGYVGYRDLFTATYRLVYLLKRSVDVYGLDLDGYPLSQDASITVLQCGSLAGNAIHMRALLCDGLSNARYYFAQHSILSHVE